MTTQLSEAIVRVREMILRGELVPGQRVAEAPVAEHGATKPFIRKLRACLHDGDALLAKHRIEENDEAEYAEMNGRFHALILEEAGSQILAEALARNGHVPFAGPQAIAFDRTSPERNYDVLKYAHRQHHVIVGAIERGESGRVDALMREHANSAKESINMASLQVSGVDVARRVALV